MVYYNDQTRNTVNADHKKCQTQVKILQLSPEVNNNWLSLTDDLFTVVANVTV